MSQESFHNYIVPGLDVLISDPSFLTPGKNTRRKADTLYIPSFYVYRLLDFYNEQTNRGESARELIMIFGEIFERMNHSDSKTCVLENGMRLEFRDFPENPVFRGFSKGDVEKHNSSKFHAIAIAKVLQDELGKDNVAIMTGSDQLATPAAFNNIDIARVNPDVYTGRTRVKFPDDLASLWWSGHAIPKDVWDDVFPNQPLIVNQYIELMFSESGQVDSGFQNIGRFDGETIVPLRTTRINNPAFSKIRPKTPGQAMLFDALLAPVEELPIVVVSGTFGTGKTFCTVATGLAQVMNGNYEQIFVCPRDGALGREIGFLKGDKLDKILPQAAPIIDNLGSVLRLVDMKPKKLPGEAGREVPIKTLVEDYQKRYFEFEPVIFMGGRSIENSFMIYDEFQDMERGQARALLSRIGNNSKIVILGDPNQTTNPHLNKTSNGLSYTASKLAGDSLAAVISFDKTREIVRSAAAKHIAERLAH
ncbi:PhoH family protein [Candidatus Saccharibacteria bacterium]|nr:PhoH family protein [Candidatus Saccharibacteria bacterium]